MAYISSLVTCYPSLVTLKRMKTITILVPAYNEEEALPLYYAEISRLTESLTSYAWDLLFVDDGSTER